MRRMPLVAVAGLLAAATLGTSGCVCAGGPDDPTAAIEVAVSSGAEGLQACATGAQCATANATDPTATDTIAVAPTGDGTWRVEFLDVERPDEVELTAVDAQGVTIATRTLEPDWQGGCGEVAELAVEVDAG
jgi:hypothetical protein